MFKVCSRELGERHGLLLKGSHSTARPDPRLVFLLLAQARRADKLA